MAHVVTGGRQFLLSTLPAESSEQKLALFVVSVSAVIFLAMAPFAKAPLMPVGAFIPIYESAVVINDLITAVLLFGQFNIVRSRALLLLASGYLFTALSTIAHALTFPGLFSPGGLLGASPQSTAWIYMFWHGGFPLFVIGYALLKDREHETEPKRVETGVSVLFAVTAVLAAVCGVTLLATVGHGLLPAIMLENRYTPAMIVVVTSTWVLSLVALAFMWARRPHSVIDLWIMVVLCVWTFDIALSAVLNHGRYDLGFYAGRVFGLLATSFVLIVLLLENGILHSRLVDAHNKLTAANTELEAFSYSVSHDLRAPLRAIDGYALMLEEDYTSRLDDEGRRLLGVVRGEAERAGQLIDDLLAFSRTGTKPITATQIDMSALARKVIAELSEQHPVARVDLGELPSAKGDAALLKQVWMNLVGNALKYSSKREAPRIEIGGRTEGGQIKYWVKDNGAGFDVRYAERLFGVFRRLHDEKEFPGTGVGLAIVRRVISRHGGRTWGEGEVDRGASFFFTLPTNGAGHA